MDQEDLDLIDKVIKRHIHYDDTSTIWRPFERYNAVVAIRDGKIIHWINNDNNLTDVVEHYSRKPWCNKDQLIRAFLYLGWIEEEPKVH